jgi:hypothetical protein
VQEIEVYRNELTLEETAIAEELKELSEAYWESHKNNSDYRRSQRAEAV